jgi:hypothetical protein
MGDSNRSALERQNTAGNGNGFLGVTL